MVHSDILLSAGKDNTEIFFFAIIPIEGKLGQIVHVAIFSALTKEA